MISYISGVVEEIEKDKVVVDNNGIGYNIQVSSSTASAVVMEKEVQIYTYMSRLELVSRLKFIHILVLGRMQCNCTVSFLGRNYNYLSC